jgi:hypothetical protein
MSSWNFSTTGAPVLLGNDNYGSFIDGNLQEMVYYRIALSDTLAQGISENLNNFYNVY